jgi:hypothetical protein
MTSIFMTDILKYIIGNWMENAERSETLEFNIFISYIIYDIGETLIICVHF